MDEVRTQESIVQGTTAWVPDLAIAVQRWTSRVCGLAVAVQQ
jgi:hypothetical protein